MKLDRKISILLLVLTISYIGMAKGEIPTEDQIAKLVEAAWKEPAHSIDITLYKQITKPPQSAEEFRQMFEKSFEKSEGPKENLGPLSAERRDRDVQLNVERSIKEQEAGRKIKQRIRIDGHRQCIDQVMGWPKMVLLEGTPYEEVRSEVVLGPNTPYNMTHVNLGDKSKGDYRSFVYYDEMKSAVITDNKKSMWARNDIIDLASPASSLRPILGTNQGTVAEPVFVPDPNKLEKLEKTGFVTDVTRITVSPDLNRPDSRERIEIKADSFPCGAIMVCDKEDYSKVYYLEACNPATGKPLYVRELNDFDRQGFPHSSITEEYDLNGEIKKSEVCTIEKVELNPSISDEVFEFSPPRGYEVVDMQSKNLAKTNKEFEEEAEAFDMLRDLRTRSDIPALRNLLSHKSWKVRLTALRKLNNLLAKEPDLLIEITMPMKHDENDLVKKEASKILQRVNTRK